MTTTEVATSAALARRIIAWTVVSQVFVSAMLVTVALVIHASDPSTADALFVGVMAFWLGHGSAFGQYAALSVVRQPDNVDGKGSP